ncbi:MAG: hypothetical protein AAB642_03950 [Patescibacteria group bacterium]
MKKLIISIIVITIIAASIGAYFVLQTPANKTATTPEGRIIVKRSGGAGLLIAECADKSYITETADYIIEGTVEKVESKWNEERTSIFTYTDLKIVKYVKGAPFTEDKLQIVTPGGIVGEIGLAVEDQPIFHEGKKVRIYLQETSGEFSIVCAQMGVEEIEQAQ